MLTAKRRPTLGALMLGIAGMAVVLAAPRISPMLELPAQLGGTLLAGLAIALYVPAHRFSGGLTLDEAMMAGLVLAVAIGTVGSGSRGSRCGAVVAPGALSAALRQGTLPSLGCDGETATCPPASLPLRVSREPR